MSRHLVIISSLCAMVVVANGLAWSGEVRPAWMNFNGATSPPPPPYQFSLGSLTPDDVLGLKQVSGVSDVRSENNRTIFTWQPYNDEPWNNEKKWIQGSEKIYGYLAIKGKVGRTIWTHGRLMAMPGGQIIEGVAASHLFGFHFDDLTLKKNVYMEAYLHVTGQPGQIIHEMLRHVIGWSYETVSCGNGNVIIWKSGFGRYVTWQMSAIGFVTIEESFDEQMVSSYIDRLGCVTNKDFQVDISKWIVEEISGQLLRLSSLWAVSDRPFKSDLVFRCQMLHRFSDLPE